MGCQLHSAQNHNTCSLSCPDITVDIGIETYDKEVTYAVSILNSGTSQSECLFLATGKENLYMKGRDFFKLQKKYWLEQEFEV